MLPEREERQDKTEFVERLVAINRVAKVVKGGRRFGFAALVVVGDARGRVGFGHGRAKEVPEAIRKASAGAKRSLIRVNLRGGRTLHHDIIGKFGVGRLVMRAAPPGSGIIAGGPVRSVFEALGITDVVVKSIGSTNPYNMIRAAFDGLKRCESPKQVAARRGLRTNDVAMRRQKVRRSPVSPVSPSGMPDMPGGDANAPRDGSGGSGGKAGARPASRPSDQKLDRPVEASAVPTPRSEEAAGA